MLLPRPGTFYLNRASDQAENLSLWIPHLYDTIDYVRGWTNFPAVQQTNVSVPGVGNVLDFGSGIATAVKTPSNYVTLDRGTFTCWIQPDFASSQTSTFYQFFDTDGARHAYFVNVGAAGRIQMYNDGRQVDYDYTWAVGDKVHLAFVYNKTGNIQRLYQNGILLSVGVAASGTWGSTALGSLFHIGNRYAATFNRFDGRMWDVRVYRVPLTQNQIWDIYTKDISTTLAWVPGRVVNFDMSLPGVTGRIFSLAGYGGGLVGQPRGLAG